MEGSTQELRHILSAPPPNWQPPPGPPPNPITILHASLEHLRNTGDEQYLFLRTLLEVLNVRGLFVGTNNNNEAAAASPLSGEEEQLLFHCVTGLRHVVLFRWESFQPSFRSCVRDLMMAAGLGLANANGSNDGTGASPGVGASVQHLPRTVSMACLSCASSFWKRGWTQTSAVDASVSETDNQQTYLESLIANSLLPGMQRFRDGQELLLFGYMNSLLASPFEQLPPPTAAAAAVNLQQRQYTAAMSAAFLSLRW